MSALLVCVPFCLWMEDRGAFCLFVGAVLCSCKSSYVRWSAQQIAALSAVTGTVDCVTRLVTNGLHSAM
jgi:hypothetical protein